MSSLLKDTRRGLKPSSSSPIDLIQNHVELLSSKMDKLMTIQEKVLSRLDVMSLKTDKGEVHHPDAGVNQTQVIGQEVKEICQEMSTIMLAVNERSEQQAQKLEGMEKLVLGMQQVISFIGETLKSSRVMGLICRGPTARKGAKPRDSKGKPATKRKSSTEAVNKTPEKLKDNKGKDGTEEPHLNLKGLKVQQKMKMKPLEMTDQTTLKKQAVVLEDVEKLNKENSEKTEELSPTYLEPGASPKCQEVQTTLKKKALVLEKVEKLNKGMREKMQGLSPAYPYLGLGVSRRCQQGDVPKRISVDFLQKVDVAVKQEFAKEVAEEEEVGEKVHEGELDMLKEPKDDVEEVIKKKDEKNEDASAVTKALEVADDAQKDNLVLSNVHQGAVPSLDAEQDQTAQISTSTTTLYVEEDKEKNEGDKEQESEGWAVFKVEGVELQLDLKEKVEGQGKEHNGAREEVNNENAARFFIDNAPPPEAPFNHRVVSAKPNHIKNFYTIYWQEVLGGGRFGQVHKCIENSSGLTFAAKVIKARSPKEKEVVKNEIQVMNNLDHANLIQLYAAYETRNDIILVLEYVSGGELFDRIIDQNYTLTELDAVMFIRQICEGVRHMHKMYILHLDLKPENILCVNRVTNKVKIVDFGLARIYKPREKLRVNFGTPEFIAPEVVNYDFVSFNTDMWSLGVITYMLLSGLSPFLGDNDSETLSNILACQWNFEEQEFVTTSNEAKDFITRLLIFNKSFRMGASEALRHPWLSDPVLHHQLHTKKNMCRSRHSSCVFTTHT
ncbi:myosin light chain kinase 2, skeletal/cardiac muscle [Thalassophryne amazonica]|uniref:myosin light chain kinase 2, skeletal/cardiac muscle n=1 Tax=Thalassophryne amazonica TaxID=390379 RepID=UPI001471E4E0|nr:myosin light chain kinase 2, skeletal/cardiac muscle [Thalassophryne amazonica]